MNDWSPSASLETLRTRARLMADVRRFFDQRSVMEVDTPILSHGATIDPHIESFSTYTHGERLWLHTSPEFAMKRLLAAGSGDIFQIVHVFRQGEAGRWHNPEFTLLEWYRVGWDQHRLMDEVSELLSQLLHTQMGQRQSYAQWLSRICGLDIAQSDTSALQQYVSAQGYDLADASSMSRDDWLDFIMGEVVGPRMGMNGLDFVTDYPASQAALAQLNADGMTAARFECYYKGLELANGFLELRDADEQRARFAADLRAREASELGCPPMDARLLAALDAGLPECAGVAVGLDRVLMLQQGLDSISQTLPFAIDRA